MSKLKLYRHPLSGHSHRAEALLSLLGLNAELIDVDLMTGAQRQPSFLQKNAFGQVPVLQDGDITVADSNAILVYLASKYDPQHQWLPLAPVAAAEVQKFLSVAAGPVASGPAAARLVTVFGAGLDHQRAKDLAHTLLQVLDAHLSERDWLVGQQPTIADVANYAYLAHAPEGEVSLADYPNVRAWLARFEQLPGYLPMQGTAVGLAA
jgi:glutathione S-transferase